VVLTTHYMDEAEVLCDRVAIMDHGRILELDSPAALVRGLGAPLRVSVDPHQLTVEQAAALPGVDDARLDAGALTLTTRQPALLLSRLAADDRLAGLQVRSASLEDVFLARTGREFRA
jgi:ABC-2 type transport system ATP-binding protein